MPQQNTQRELKILRAAREQGKSDEFIKSVIRVDRQRRTQTQQTQQTQPTEKPKGDFLGKASKALDVVFGGGKLGEAIGTAIARKRAPEDVKPFIGKGPSAKEVVGSIGRSAALFTPVGRVAGALGAGAKALGAGSKLSTGLGRVGAGASTGFSFDVAGGLERGVDVSEAIKPGVGTLVGGILPGAGAAGRGFRKSLETNIPKRMISSALKLSPKQAASTAGKKAVEQIQTKRIGTINQLLGDSKESVRDLSEQISNILKTTTRTRISKDEVVKRIQNDPFFSDAGLTVEEVIEQVTRLTVRARTLLNKKTLTLTEANRLRQIIDSTLGDRFFDQQNPAITKEILNAFSRNLSEIIKRRAPVTRDLFAELSKEISLRKTLDDAVVKGVGNQAVSMRDLIGAVIGSAAFGPLGAAGGILAKQTVESVPFKTGISKVSRKIGASFGSLPETGKAGSKLLLDLLQRTRSNQKE